MLDRIGKINKNKHMEVEQNNTQLSKQIEIRNDCLIKEKYSRSTLQSLYERLQKDLTSIKKEIVVVEDENMKIGKLTEKERLKETAIKEIVNQLHVKAKKLEKVL